MNRESARGFKIVFALHLKDHFGAGIGHCGVSHLKKLRIHLERLAAVFSCNIGDVQSHELNAWLKKLPGGGRNRNGHRESLTNCFHYARNNGLLPRSLPTAADTTDGFVENPSENEIFPAAELKALLSQCPARLVPLMAIKALSGIRIEELFKLEWQHFSIRLNNPIPLTAFGP